MITFGLKKVGSAAREYMSRPGRVLVCPIMLQLAGNAEIKTDEKAGQVCHCPAFSQAPCLASTETAEKRTPRRKAYLLFFAPLPALISVADHGN
jgi:hypothetical protein